MLRSFDYAARSLLLDGQEDSQLAYRAGEWSARNRGAFCAGYGEESGKSREHAVLLRGWRRQAVYETMYEARNRRVAIHPAALAGSDHQRATGVSLAEPHVREQNRMLRRQHDERPPSGRTRGRARRAAADAGGPVRTSSTG